MYINLCTKSNKILFSFFTFSNLIISKHGVSKRERKEREAETQISRTKKRDRQSKKHWNKRERDIETERDRDRERHRERERHTERDRERERDTERDRERKKEILQDPSGTCVFVAWGYLERIFLESSQCYAKGPRIFFEELRSTWERIIFAEFLL